MKKFILAAIAALTLATTPAVADPRISFGFSVSDGYYRDYNDRNYRYNRGYDRGYYSRYRSYYPGSCRRREVVVVDPYTGRRICIDRRELRRDYYRY